ncbi:hypothetical protein IWW50_001799 [Coemansia erecta]|nr:hypothetical protein GGF43_001055 [Coemansia sp. RSA 2618]KAJ2827624.1 hypothetical protein IWW50_001799 [Coemansia erecta]
MFGRSAALRLACGARTFSTTRKAAGTAVRAALVLQRDPIVVQQAAGFEAAADQYFDWLEYMSAEKFPREFFFKQGSSAEGKWEELDQVRASTWYFDSASKPKSPSGKKAARAKAEDEEAEDDARDEVSSAGKGGQTVDVQPRETQADRENDDRSLERKLDRTLYLVVKDAQGQWVFPQSAVQGEELLHETARRSLKDTCGAEMSVWTVGQGPIGHHKSGDHTAFFVKGHILAGRAVATKNKASDFKWITREEVESVVAADYWKSIKDILSRI